MRIVKLLACFSLFVFHLNLIGQISMKNEKVCLGDVAMFSYNPPADVQVNAFEWDFGNSYTAKGSNPNHLFRKEGVFQVVLTATKVTGGQIKDTLMVEVLPLPKAIFEYDQLSDTCMYVNEICFTNKSKEAKPGQNIVKTILLWGDGAYDKANSNTFNKEYCHEYIKPDRYTVTYEVTDTFGCKDRNSSIVNIVPSVKADFTPEISFPECGKVVACIRNTSTTTDPSSIKYKWDINGQELTDPFFNSSNCYSTTSYKKLEVKLFASHTNGCGSEFYDTVHILADTFERKIKKNDSVFCIGNKNLKEQPHFWIDVLPGERYEWRLNGKRPVYGVDTLFTHMKGDKLEHGWHYVRCKVIRGTCTLNLLDSFEIKGPVADFKIFNKYQCVDNRDIDTVYLVNKSKHYDINTTAFKWIVTDPNGGDCIINRDKGKNLYKNCNVTEGWFAKHLFSDKNIYFNPVQLIVTDTVYGCVDTMKSAVYLGCGFGEGLGGPSKEYNTCQGVWFPYKDKSPKDPDYMTLDSGKTWLPFPYIFDTSYSGRYNLGFKSNQYTEEWVESFGNDSIIIHPSRIVGGKTTLGGDFITINEIIYDSIRLELQEGCSPKLAHLYFENGYFLPQDTIVIYWGDTVVQVIGFSDTTQLDSVIHTYEVSGLSDTVFVEYYSRFGCVSLSWEEVQFGYSSKLALQGPFCKDKEVCMTAGIKDYVDGKVWTNSNGLGKIKWLLNGVELDTVNYSLCHMLTSVGEHKLQLLSSKDSVCFDTITKNFIVQDIVANVTNESRIYYCNELGQFFDSSKLVLPIPNDEIAEYLWDFGTNKFTTVEKDPLHSFPNVFGEVFVKHAVISKTGCSDTIEFTVEIVGPEPYFEIQDTIGCDPFTVNFINKSKNSKGYIWEFGDVTNGTRSMDNEDSVVFVYREEGTYDVHLVGLDTVYNPYTGNVYHCKTIFPGFGKYKDLSRRVTVLPSYKADFEVEDSVCKGEKVKFISKSDPNFEYDYWSFGDGNTTKKEAGLTFDYTYKNGGTYLVTLTPFIQSDPRIPYCHDSAVTKEVFIDEVNALFSKEAIGCDPILHFKNESDSQGVQFEWDFGDFKSNSDLDTSIHAIHNFGVGNKTYKVCLTATNDRGCTDTYCQSFTSNYEPELEIYNVFTPFNNDSYNDEYSVDISGYSKYELTICNRWGQVVYQKGKERNSGDSVKWNGRVNNTGEACPSGTYFFVLKYNLCIEPENEKTMNGVITLISEGNE